jgi:hypothetical protein
LQIIATRDKQLIQPERGDQVYLNDILLKSLCWSPNSLQLAFFSYADGRGPPPGIYAFDMPAQRLTRLVSQALNTKPDVEQPPQLLWSDAEKLLVHAYAMTDTQAKIGIPHASEIRRDWWLVAPNGHEICLTTHLTTPPHRTHTRSGAAFFYWSCRRATFANSHR